MKESSCFWTAYFRKMGATCTVAGFFRQLTECMRCGHFLQNYRKSQQARILVQRVPYIIFSIVSVTNRTGPD